MSESPKKLNYIFPTVFLATVITTLFRTYFLVHKIEPESGLYELGTNARFIFNIVLIVSVLAIFTVCFLYPKNLLFTFTHKNVFSIITTSLCGLMLFCVFANDILSLASKKEAFGFAIAIRLLFCALSSVYFFMLCADKRPANAAVTTFFSLCPGIFTAIRLIVYFLDTKVVITASQRHLMLLTMCAAMLFLLYGAKLSLPKPKNNSEEFTTELEKSQKKDLFLYASFTSLCFFFVIVSVLPHFLLSAFWIVKADMAFTYYFLDISLALFCLSSLAEHFHFKKA